MGVSFIAIENFLIEKYKGKSSFKEALLEEANTKQIEKNKINYNDIDDINIVQRTSKEALFEDHYDFRLLKC